MAQYFLCLFCALLCVFGTPVAPTDVSTETGVKPVTFNFGNGGQVKLRDGTLIQFGGGGGILVGRSGEVPTETDVSPLLSKIYGSLDWNTIADGGSLEIPDGNMACQRVHYAADQDMCLDTCVSVPLRDPPGKDDVKRGPCPSQEYPYLEITTPFPFFPFQSTLDVSVYRSTSTDEPTTTVEPSVAVAPDSEKDVVPSIEQRASSDELSLAKQLYENAKQQGSANELIGHLTRYIQKAAEVLPHRPSKEEVQFCWHGFAHCVEGIAPAYIRDIIHLKECKCEPPFTHLERKVVIEIPPAEVEVSLYGIDVSDSTVPHSTTVEPPTKVPADSPEVSTAAAKIGGDWQKYVPEQFRGKFGKGKQNQFDWKQYSFGLGPEGGNPDATNKNADLACRFVKCPHNVPCRNGICVSPVE